MKRMLSLSLLLSLSAAAAAQTPPKPYVGLFADDAHMTFCISAAQFTPFDLWLWWLPGTGGIQAVECGIAYPSNVVMTSHVINPDVVSAIPSCCSAGECCCVFSSCHTDWVFLLHQSFIVIDAGPSIIEIVPYSWSGGVNAATCEPGYPIVPAIVLTNFGINAPWVCVLAVETSTWGAIKNLYR